MTKFTKPPSRSKSSKAQLRVISNDSPAPLSEPDTESVEKSIIPAEKHALASKESVNKDSGNKDSGNKDSAHKNSTHRNSNGENADLSFQSMAHYMRYAYLTLCILIFVVGGWAVLSRIQGAVITTGQVAVDQNPQIIQHIEGGIIRSVHVKDGDLVAQGDILMQLDPSLITARKDTAQTEFYANEALISRLEAEHAQDWRIQWRQSLQVADDPDSSAQDGGPITPEATQTQIQAITSAKATQKALFEARQTALKGQIQQLKQRITRYKDEDRGLTSEIAFTKTELSQLSAELDKTRRLLARSLVPRSRVTELERQHIRLSNQDAQLRNRRNLIASSITEAQIEINQLHKARQEEVLTQLSEARRRADAFNEALKTADKRAEHIIIKAPMEGYIHKFGPNTLGGIIAPGQEIMQIIPKREKLLLSAQILPSDIDQVSYGQKTKVIFSALNLDAPPELSGTVSFISPDSLIDETHGGAYYLVDIEIAPSELIKLKGESLKPGMPADIYIQTQTRSVMQYLLAPLRKTLRSSMKDG